MKNCIFVACPMIEKEVEFVLKTDGFPYPVIFLPPDLHKGPEELHKYLQAFIDRTRNVDTIMLSVARCGNSTVGLKATTANLVIPKCDDCIDLLLSTQGFHSLKRPERSCFFTESWLKYMGDFEFSFAALMEHYGEGSAVDVARTMFQGLHDFYVVDTGVFPVPPVKDYIRPLAKVIGAEIKVIPGSFWVLRKMMSMEIDDDFIVIPRGNIVREQDFTFYK